MCKSIFGSWSTNVPTFALRAARANQVISQCKCNANVPHLFYLLYAPRQSCDKNKTHLLSHQRCVPSHGRMAHIKNSLSVVHMCHLLSLPPLCHHRWVWSENENVEGCSPTTSASCSAFFASHVMGAICYPGWQFDALWTAPIPQALSLFNTQLQQCLVSSN